MATALISIIWLSHIVVFLLYVVPFFIPERKFRNKLQFQFFYMLTVILIQALWGLFFLSRIGKYMLVCPITTLMQYLRGYPVTDPLNYGHSFIVEFLQVFNLPAVPIKPIMFGLLLIVIIQIYRKNL